MDSIQYHRSEEFPSETWNNNRFPTQFRPRISKYAYLCDDACWAVRDELAEAGVPESIAKGFGCVDSVTGNAIALWFPEALPERLYIAAYMVEYAFAHDDVADSVEDFDESNQAMIASLDGATQGNKKNQINLVLKSIRTRFAVEALEVDEELGNWLIEEWKEQLNVKAEARDKDYRSIEEYLEFRLIDAGANCALVMRRFVTDTTISRAGIESVRYLSNLLYHAQILVNDLASWQKEIDAYESGKTNSLVNAVSVLMKVHSIDAEAAKKLLWDQALEYERQYCEDRDLFIKNNSPEPEFYHWFRVLELCNGGSAVWSLSTARYSYNKSAPRPVRAPKTSGVKANGSTAHHHSEDKPRPAKIHKVGGEFSRNGNGSVDELEEAKLHGDGNPSDRDAARNGSDLASCDHDKSAMELDEDVITNAPYIYIASLPAKGARDHLIDSLQTWYQVPEASLDTIRSVVAMMHNISLMIDDIQDHSPMRRGFPSTHMVFGVEQTINAATYVYAKSVEQASKLSPATFLILIEEVKRLHVGQAHDLHSTYHCTAPSIPAYFKLIEQKTGGIFRTVSRMMQSEATKNVALNIDTLMNLLGRYYQLRDDYQDITGTSAGKSTTYNDLDQGTFTLPVIHALSAQEKTGSTELLNILQSRSRTNGMPPAMKMLTMKVIEEAGSLKYTKAILDDTYEDLKNERDRVEESAGSKTGF